MDLRAHLLALIAPAAVGDELVPGVRVVAVSVDPRPALRLVGPAGELVVEVSARADTPRSAATSARLAFSYRSLTASAVGLAVCVEVARRAAAHEDAFLAAVASAGDPAAPRLREIEVDALLELAGSDAERFYACSPYVGCLIGCRFCYAQAPLAATRALVGLPPARWGSWVDARINAPAVLAAELARLPPHPIKFCPVVSDPYHAVEARLGLTRRCLEAVAAAPAPPPVMLLTRSTLVARDLDLLARLPRAWVGMSVPTIDDAVRAHFEPRAASVRERLATLATLRAAGVRTFAMVQPLLPGSVDALVAALASCVDSVSLDVLRGEGDAPPLFDDPRFAAARTPAWQAGQAAAVAAALTAAGVPVWPGELPPDL